MNYLKERDNIRSNESNKDKDKYTFKHKDKEAEKVNVIQEKGRRVLLLQIYNATSVAEEDISSGNVE